MRLPRVPPARPARSRLLAPSQQVALFLLQAVSIGMGICVGQARKKYGVTYPALYAVPGTKSDYSPVTEDTALLKEEKEKKEAVVSDQTAYEFNCIQRGHQNFLEQVQTGGLERPLPFILHGRRAGCAPTLPSIACSVTLRPGARSVNDQVTCFIPLVVLNWFTFPLLAGVCGVLWTLLKIGYFVGYGYFGTCEQRTMYTYLV